MEKGTLFLLQEDYNKALYFYEKGIEVEPEFPSNYMRAAKLYHNSDQEVWGMIYGEIFMNMERGSKRTTEMGKILFDTYQSEIQFKSDTAASVSFSNNNTIYITAKDLKKKNLAKLLLPFGAGYEQNMLLATLGEKDTSLPSLVRIRTRFLDAYYQMGHDKSYPNILFDYQRKLQQAGHLEAYHYWILGDGDVQAFNAWVEANQTKWDSFISWFKENQMEVNNKHKFSSSQYN